MIRHKKTERDEVMGETRARLLQAAAEVFARRGYEGANVNVIAKSAGFSIGTMYNYFPSKRDLMDAFIDEFSQQHVDFIQERVLAESDPARRIESFFLTGFSFVEMHVIWSKAIFNTLNGHDEGFRQHLFQAYLPLFQLLSQEVLSPGIERGIFQQVEPLATANLIMLIYLGVASQFSPQGNLWLDPQQVSGFVLAALRVGGGLERKGNDE
ncbi:MAG: TetR/AcrR family transcriptional regulator [Anaerolineales bacterium]|nr:MAG: TetR/AcrR family transcriptional regulator [Anaerolineales bacterium]